MRCLLYQNRCATMLPIVEFKRYFGASITYLLDVKAECQPCSRRTRFSSGVLAILSFASWHAIVVRFQLASYCRTVFARVRKDEAAVQHASFHSWIKGSLFNPAAFSVYFVRASPCAWLLNPVSVLLTRTSHQMAKSSVDLWTRIPQWNAAATNQRHD